MESLEDYIDYGVIFSLSILTVSLSYFVDFSNLYTLLLLVLLPIQLGFIAEISKAGFHKASLISAAALFFVFLGSFTAFIAVLTVFMSLFTSFFAGGRRFKDFYSSTALPLLLTGLLIGGASYYMVVNDEGIESQLEDTLVDITLEVSEHIVGDQVEDASQEQAEMIEQSTEGIVLLTHTYVINQTSENLDTQEMQYLESAFASARQEVPQMAAEEQGEHISEEDIRQDQENQMENMVRQNIDSQYYAALIPMIGMFFYSLQPVIGVFTAIFGLAFYRIRSNS